MVKIVLKVRSLKRLFEQVWHSVKQSAAEIRKYIIERINLLFALADFWPRVKVKF